MPRLLEYIKEYFMLCNEPTNAHQQNTLFHILPFGDILVAFAFIVRVSYKNKNNIQAIAQSV